MKIDIRKAVAADQSLVMDIIIRTDFFRQVEVIIAREVFEEAVSEKPGCTYQSYVATIDNKVVGWICFGQTPCTLGTFDIYWIAVERDHQRHHVGTEMLSFAEGQIASQKGRLSVVETSGSDKYKATQKFYIKNGYHQAASVADFYAPGDSKLIFTKVIG